VGKENPSSYNALPTRTWRRVTGAVSASPRTDELPIRDRTVASLRHVVVHAVVERDNALFQRAAHLIHRYLAMRGRPAEPPAVE
jgi:hypothetical protein